MANSPAVKRTNPSKRIYRNFRHAFLQADGKTICKIR